MARAVAERFAEALAEGPRAETAHERRGLLRYANEAIVAQVLGYLSRRHTTGDVESFVRAFTCECADPECDADVEVSVAAFERAAAAGPVLAASHR